MRNDAVVRALELLSGVEVARCDMPELMGAYGCALYAKRYSRSGVRLDDMLAKAGYTSRTLHCKGCDNTSVSLCVTVLTTDRTTFRATVANGCLPTEAETRRKRA